MKRTQSGNSKPLLRHALFLEYLTVGWNVLEAAVAIGAGWIAGSIALVGFGLDSVIEVTAAGMLIWRLRCELSCLHTTHAGPEGKALKVVGVTFFLLAAYVGYQALWQLWRHQAPHVSLPGLGLALASGLLMPFLGLRKRWVARKLGSRALEADAMETLICAYLSAALLLGLGLNAWLGWWWADPVAALVMLPVILQEGRETLKEGGSDAGHHGRSV